jgi:hypothetical protein
VLVSVSLAVLIIVGSVDEVGVEGCVVVGVVVVVTGG